MTIVGPTEAGMPERFELAATFPGTDAVVAIRGELDLATIPMFSGFLDAAVADDRRTVVLDLSEVSFLDARGLGAIVLAVQRVAGSGGHLLLRAPSPVVRRLLHITGLTGAFGVEEAALDPHLGAAQALSVPLTATMLEGSELGHNLQRVSAASADADVVDAALRLVVALAQVTVAAADGVSISLRRHGQLSTVAASDQTVLDMDAGQYATGEGPCVAASEEGRWFHIERLDSERRWPDFTPRALALGINAILSSPLISDEQPVGALNIYSRTAAAFTPKDQELAAVFATEASVILSAAAELTGGEVTERFRAALRSRELIAIAEGILMERVGLSEDGAYRHLLHLSRKSSRPLTEHASELVASSGGQLSDGLAAGVPHG